ncbi:5-oxoprolinase subunit PxpA [Rheinheimera sp.]|uniref:5-oxoprolinase subunit PxpA n=1 Tax=Rheinheimera sp. TaxID=1869214 RepID=UPI003AF8B5B2
MLKLNCDLGESYSLYRLGNDQAVMPLIDQANIACGFHAGDPSVLHQTLKLAIAHQVDIGAHPSYDDKPGFGRRSVSMSSEELRDLIWYQIAAVDGVARTLGGRVCYVKPHGALYNDMMRSPQLLQTVMQAVAAYHSQPALMLLSDANRALHQQRADQFGLTLYFEAFADRRYQADGSLTPRSQPGAVLTEAQALAQVRLLLTQGLVEASDGSKIALQADSLCVHGDTPSALAMLQQIRQSLGSD